MITSVIDLPLCIERLVPSAIYFGTTVDNSLQDYENLNWIDSRTKPTWDEIITIDLSVCKELQKDIIKTAFNDAVQQGCGTYLGFKVDCKPEDISNWTSTLVLLDISNLPDDYMLEIRDFDNITRYITVSQFKMMCIQVGTYYNNLFSMKWKLQNQIDSSTNRDEIFSIQWQFPQVD